MSHPATPVAEADLHGQPRLFQPGFTCWLIAATVSATGDGVLYFAVAWSATGLGGQVAGLVLTVGVLPRAVLMLLGGAVGDRLGLRRTMIACDLAMCLVLLSYLGVQRSSVPVVYLLAGLELVTGTVNAFHLPASGAFPRLFVNADLLPRAMSLTGSALQVARLAGPPLGGLVVAELTMTGAVAADLLSFMAVLPALLLIRPPRETPVDQDQGSTIQRIRHSLAIARTIPGVLPMLGAVSLAAATIIPMLSLCVPVAAHERGWSADTTGLVEACWISGSLVTSLIIAKIGAHPRPILPMVAGAVTAAMGILVIGVTSGPIIAMTAAAVMGIGTVLFTSHVFPVFLVRTPDQMLARFQSLLGLVQIAPMLLANNLLGAVAAASGATAAMILTASLTLLAPAVLVSSRTFRQLRSNT